MVGIAVIEGLSVGNGVGFLVGEVVLGGLVGDAVKGAGDVSGALVGSGR